MLRDWLVCGINDEQIQRRLLAESSLDFKKAMKIATSMEAAVKNARDLTNQMANANINTENLQHYTVWTTRDKETNHGQGLNVVDVGLNMTLNNANFAMLSVSCATRKDT
jgi:uncharacterized protein YjbK